MKKEKEVGVLELVEGKYGGDFMGKKCIHLFSQDYEIQLRFNVYDEMVKAAKACLEAFNGSTDRIEEKIKEYYDRNVVPIIEDMDEYVDIDGIVQLAQMMRPKELYITSFKIGLYFECDWDDEKGFGIKFDTNGNIIKMGTGGVVY